ncbi:MerR family transcriptional regulator [Actinomadura sp. NEAU-AAG7]|uniref:MerR family transcriptional regulator n=1 Tax=Actinomadura sp. NEAU-AAG7 TaxID=2839640 RepID=UPI0020322A63|nr:MerR family transcriptional regulator [Actinomadura sp. NEAU-AAG7]
MDGTWTIGELAERAVAALAAGESAQVSGRVRDMPNERLIRWYTTIGLVDPPLARRGRTALYGRRHLLQLTAVKRRQAAGRSIAEIQLELAAATDAKLEQIAALPAPGSPAPPAATSGPQPTDAPSTDAVARPRKSAASTGQRNRTTGRVSGSPKGAPHPTPSPADTTESRNARPPDSATSRPAATPTPARPGTTTEAPETAAPPHQQEPTTSAPDSAWTSAAVDLPSSAEEPPGTAAGDVAGSAGRPRFWSTRPDVTYDRDVSVDYDTPPPALVQGVRLAPGLTLLLEVSMLGGDDLAAIQTAAEPLLEELRRRGLVPSPILPTAPPRRSQ